MYDLVGIAVYLIGADEQVEYNQERCRASSIDLRRANSEFMNEIDNVPRSQPTSTSRLLENHSSRSLNIRTVDSVEEHADFDEKSGSSGFASPSEILQMMMGENAENPHVINLTV